MRHPTARTALALSLTVLPTTALAQSDLPRPGERPGVHWTVLDAIGYAGLGFGLGLLASWDLEGEDFGPPPAALVIIGSGTAAGLVGGALIGQRARRAVATGRSPTPAHRSAALAGLVLAGGTLGALAAVPLINPDGEGTPLGSDETTVLALAAAGTALGGLFAWSRRGSLTPGVRVTPEVRRDGGYGMGVRLPFGSPWAARPAWRR